MDHYHQNDDEFDYYLNNNLLFCNAIEQCADYFMEAMSLPESTTTTSSTQELLQSINNLLLRQQQNTHHDDNENLMNHNLHRYLLDETKEGESRGYADDATWILTASFVILTMQSGFGLLEAGSCSPGYEINVMMKNIVDVIFSALAFYLVGYGIAFGEPSIPFMGLSDMPADGGYDEVSSGLLYSRYVFQLSFAATATTIVSGCVAMRMKFVVYCIFSFISTIFYSFCAHWLFTTSGWLNQLGAHDFAGGASVHIFGGINGLVAILFLGPRTGRFDGTRPISDFFPSSPTSQLFGLFMLWWGWIGFNCGSSFGITDDKWVVAIRCAVTTINSTVGGGTISILYSLWRTNWRLIIPEHVVNGILGSLVAITPACASVHTYDAFPIGIIGGLVGLSMNTLICHLQLDDPVGAVGVHAAGGIWGMISVGLFADSQLPGINVQDGLFRSGGDWSLLGFQLVAILSVIGWAVTWSSIFFYLVGCGFSRDLKNPRIGLRQNATEDERGADWYLHGVVDQFALAELNAASKKTTEHDESDYDDDDDDDHDHDDDDDDSILSFTGYNDDDDDNDNDSFDIHHQVPPSSPKTTNHPRRKQLLTRKSDMYYRSSIERDFQTPRHFKGLAFLDNSDRSRRSSDCRNHHVHYHNESDNNNNNNNPIMSLSGSERSSNCNSRSTPDNNVITKGSWSSSDENVDVIISRSPQRQQREESAPPPPHTTTTTTTVSSPPRLTRTTTAATAIDDDTTSNNNNNNLRYHRRGSNSIDRMLGQNRRSSSRSLIMTVQNSNNNDNELSPQRQQQLQRRDDDNGGGGRSRMVGRQRGGRGGGLSRQNNSRNLSKELRIYR